MLFDSRLLNSQMHSPNLNDVKRCKLNDKNKLDSDFLKFIY